MFYDKTMTTYFIILSIIKMNYSVARRSKAEIMLLGAAGQFIVNGKAPMNQENLPIQRLNTNF